MPAPEFTLPTTGTSPKIATRHGLEAGINAVSQALFDQIGAISTGLKPAGNWDASGDSFPSGAERGTYYVVNIAGTVDGAAFAIGDWLIPLVDGPETGTYADNWFRGDYSKVVPLKYENVAGLFASLEVPRGIGELWETKDGHRFLEVSTNEDRTMEGGAKLQAITGSRGLELPSFGAVADYTGTPEYDGSDASRITATDNHDAWIAFIKAIVRTGLPGHIPKGHYGIKTPHAVADAIATTNDVRIIAEPGAVLDFIYEDLSGTTYTTDAAAHMMLRMTASGGAKFYAENLLIKATTRFGPIGSSGQIQYHGKVFGIRLDGFSEVHHKRCGAEWFVFKGWTVVNSDRWLIEDCDGHHNLSSGWWGAAIKEMDVEGGRYTYNGLLTHGLTGYGVTAQQSVENFNIEGGRYYRNHKGVDSHGSKNFRSRNARYICNTFYGIGLSMNTGTAYTGGFVDVDGNLFDLGSGAEDEAWLRDIYTQQFANGSVDRAGNAFNYLEAPGYEGTVDHFRWAGNNKVLGGYRGGDVLDDAYHAVVRVDGDAVSCEIVDSLFDVPKMGDATSNDAGYMRSLIGLPNNPNLKHTFSRNKVLADWDSEHLDDDTATAFGKIIGMDPGCLLDFEDNEIVIRDHWLFSGNPGGTTFQWADTHRIIMRKNRIVADRQSLSPETDKWFGRKGYLDPSRDVFEQNTFIIDGVAHTLSGMPDTTDQKRQFRSPRGVSWANTDTVARIILDPAGRMTLKFYAFSINVGTQAVVDVNFNATSATVTGAPANMSVSTDTAYVDPLDGVTKVAIILTATAAIAAPSDGGAIAIHTECHSRQGSFGVERIDFVTP